MAFIQFELDALGGAHMVAGLVGVPYQQVTGGLIELWAWCWRAGSELATPEQIAGTMAIPHPGLVNALVAGGFLEKVEAGWRVRGSSRYLRITERQEVAGRARAASAKRVGGRFVSPATDQPLTSNQPATDQPLTSNSPASHQQLRQFHQPLTSQSPASHQPPTSRSPAAHQLLHRSPITDHR